MDVRLLIVNSAALDDLKFLCFSPGSAHMDKDSLFMEERIQSIYSALRHPAPFLFGEIDYFSFQIIILHDSSLILLVADMFHPVSRFTIVPFHNGYMLHFHG